MKTALIFLLLFISLRSWSFIRANRQQKIIVYNVPGKSAMDLVQGRGYYFMGDSSLLKNDFARNFHLKPSRIMHRITPGPLPLSWQVSGNYISCGNKHVLVVNDHISFLPVQPSIVIDLLVVSGKENISIPQLSNSLQIKQVVFDGSVPAWKSKSCKKDCDSLQIAWHDVNMSGAFILDW